MSDSHRSSSHKSSTSSSSHSHQSNRPYNPNLARFQRANPGKGPHGFGGTFKKGEKGGLWKPRAKEDEVFVPLAERGLKGPKTPLASASHKKAAVTHTGATSCSAIKSKIRDLTRLLKKPDLDPTVKKHKEQELKLVQKALVDKQNENAASKIDDRYKTIKFYERRKITRKLAALQRSLSTLYSRTGGDVMSAAEKELRKEMAKWQLDADYIDYYPHGEKYIALFRGSAEKSQNAAESDDEQDGETKKDATKPAPTPAEVALESARAAIRKRVAQAKAAAVRKERETLGTTPTQKRKREDTTQDQLFQVVASDSDEDESDSDEEEEKKLEKKSSSTKSSKQQLMEEPADELMVSASDSEDNDAAESNRRQKDASTKSTKPSTAATFKSKKPTAETPDKVEQPVKKKQKQQK